MTVKGTVLAMSQPEAPSPASTTDSTSTLYTSTSVLAATHGQYSLERLFMLQAYTSSKSYARVFVMCLLIMLVPLVTILTLESFPLQHPSDGWHMNSTFWVRVYVQIFIISMGVAFQLQAMAPAAQLTFKKCFFASIPGAAGFVGSLLPLAHFIGFPVPFSIVLGVPVWLLCFLPGIALGIGVERLKRDLVLQDQVRRFFVKINLETSFMIVYPVYSKVFLSLSDEAQFFFIFVLQLIKFVLKRLMAKLASGYEDLVPVVIISVDLFHAIYQSKCMQSSQSIYTTLGIIAIDVCQNVVLVTRLSRHMSQVQSLANAAGVTSSNGLLNYVLKLADEPEKLGKSETLLDVRLWASPSMHPSETQMEVIRKLELIQKELAAKLNAPGTVRKAILDSPNVSALAGSKLGRSKFFRISAILPIALPTNNSHVSPETPGGAGGGNDSSIATTDHPLLIKKSLELLWKCELILLVEYIETAIPLLYSMYLIVLYHLPNAKYYAELSDQTPEELQSAVTGIVLYALLEALSLICLHTVLMRKFHISALHQLAFVFENDWLVIQSAFMAWVILILQFTLAHNGKGFVL